MGNLVLTEQRERGKHGQTHCHFFDSADKSTWVATTQQHFGLLMDRHDSNKKQFSEREL